MWPQILYKILNIIQISQSISMGYNLDLFMIEKVNTKIILDIQITCFSCTYKNKPIILIVFYNICLAVKKTTMKPYCI